MIGYASSSDNNGNCSKIIITVLYADDFAFEDYGFPKETYSVDRKLERVTKLYPDDGVVNPPYSSLVKIATMLHLEELKSARAVRISWNMSDRKHPRLISSSPIDGVWFPAPAIVGKCGHMCINITGLVFKSTPKPLEASLFCDMMNNLLLLAGVRVASPFYNCFNSVFCSVEIVKPMSVLLGDEFLSVSENENLAKMPKNKAVRLKRASISPKAVITALDNCRIPRASFDGNAHSFIVNLKRDCLKKIVDEFIASIKHKTGYKSFLSGVALYVGEAVERIMVLAELFEISGNIDRASDIKYLTFYEATEAFSLNEAALRLKRTVRTSQMRQSDLNKMHIPAVVYPDASYI